MNFSTLPLGTEPDPATSILMNIEGGSVLSPFGDFCKSGIFSFGDTLEYI